MLNSKPLIYFATVAETGSFTLAAKKLGIAQPAMSMAIKKLEQHIGVALIHRYDKSIALTGEGEVLLVHARQIAQQLRDAELAMEELKGLEKGEVRFGVPSMLGSFYFPPLMMGFKARYPNLKLTIIEGGGHTIREMLLRGELDLGVIPTQDAPSSLVTEPLLTPKMVCVCAADSDLAQQQSIDYETFFDHELVMYKSGYFHREIIDKISRQYNLTPNIAFETNLLPMIVSLVKRGFGISALIQLVVDEVDGLVGIPFKDDINFSLSIAWRRSGYLSLADRAFLAFIRQHR